MVNYKELEKRLNDEAIRILLLVKSDYYQYMGENAKKTMDSLLESKQVINVNTGLSKFEDNTLAHGGRALEDGKIHFYPDTRNYETTELAFEKCVSILPHEIFHYFIQPDRIIEREARELADFYTEGIVEKETRKFCKRHSEEIKYEEANYGYNINFVNMIQGKLNANNYNEIFGDRQYLSDIGIYEEEYRQVIKSKERDLAQADELALKFPKELQRRIKNAIRHMALQHGNLDEATKKINCLKSQEEIER